MNVIFVMDCYISSYGFAMPMLYPAKKIEMLLKQVIYIYKFLTSSCQNPVLEKRHNYTSLSSLEYTRTCYKKKPS
jgi:hypothetical protein